MNATILSPAARKHIFHSSDRFQSAMVQQLMDRLALGIDPGAYRETTHGADKYTTKMDEVYSVLLPRVFAVYSQIEGKKITSLRVLTGKFRRRVEDIAITISALPINYKRDTLVHFYREQMRFKKFHR